MPGKLGNSPLLTHFGRGTNDCKKQRLAQGGWIVIVK